MPERPGLALFLTEGSCALGEYGVYRAACPLLYRALPRGDEPDVVLPGFLRPASAVLQVQVGASGRGLPVRA